MNKKFNIGLIIGAVIIGYVGTSFINKLGDDNVKKYESARHISDTLSVSEFLKQNDGNYAVYTGKIVVENPVSIYGFDGTYMYIHKEVEEEHRYYDDEEERWETEWRTISTKTEKCNRVNIDDVTVSFDLFKSLPKDSHTEKHYDERYTYTYIDKEKDGTYFIEANNGSITSIKYYSSPDIADSMKSTTAIIVGIYWVGLVIIAILIMYVLNMGSI